MENKMDWYNSLPLAYVESKTKCYKCGESCIETIDGTLCACINNDCSIGFFNNPMKG